MKTINVFIILLLLVFTSNISSAQSKHMRYKINYRHSIEPIINYNRGFNILDDSKNSKNSFERSEKFNGALLDYIQVGINYGFSLRHNLLVVSGLQYSNPAMRTNSDTRLDLKDASQAQKDRLDQTGVVLRRNFLEIPSLLRYTVTKGSACKSYVELGVLHQFYTISSYNNVDESFGLRKDYFNENQDIYHQTAQLNIGAEFKLFEYLPAFTQINMAYQLKPMKQLDTTDRNLGIGFATGIRIRI